MRLRAYQTEIGICTVDNNRKDTAELKVYSPNGTVIGNVYHEAGAYRPGGYGHRYRFIGQAVRCIASAAKCERAEEL